MLEGHLDEAEALAEKALADPKADRGEALFVKARVLLMENDPKDSESGFEEVLATAKSPRTLAWSHIYLGRLYDTKVPAERPRAISQYKAALAVAGSGPEGAGGSGEGVEDAVRGSEGDAYGGGAGRSEREGGEGGVQAQSAAAVIWLLRQGITPLPPKCPKYSKEAT